MTISFLQSKKLVLFIYCLFFSQAVLKANIFFRSEISQKINPYICENPTKPFHLQKLWEKGLYDTQIIGLRLQSKNELEFSYLKQKAHDFAKKTNRYGFSYGRCSKNNAWIIATRAAGSLNIKDGFLDSYRNKISENHCKSMSVLYAHAKKGRSTKLAITKKSRINLNRLAEGTVGFYCNKQKKTLKGTSMWFLAPTGNGPQLHAHLSTNYASSQLLNWINALRQQENLGPLKQNNVLKKLVKALNSSTSIDHNLTLMDSSSQTALKHGFMLIGENKIKSHNFDDLTWLLWNSPKHRDLILSPTSTLISIYNKTVEGQKFTILVTALQKDI